MSAFHFQSLTPDLILNALESIEIYPESGLLALNSYENRVYQFINEDQKRYVVKFYRPERWKFEQIQEELDFACELYQEGIPVATPIRVDGRTLHTYETYFFALFPSLGGRTLEVDQTHQFKDIGQFIGRIHQQSAAQPFTKRPSINLQEMGYDALKHLEQSQHVPVHLENAYFTVAKQVLEKAKSLWKQVSYTPIRLHGDLHQSNILQTQDGLGFVDLDDARMGPAISDLWMLLSGSDAEQQQQLNLLIEGYQTFCEIPSEQLKLIEVLRSVRIIYYTAWLSRRWDDPAFPHNFPWFLQDKYWEQQILLLKEQLAQLDAEPLKIQSNTYF